MDAGDGSSPSLDQVLLDVSRYIQRLHLLRWCCVAITSVLIYDIITTFDREIQYVWRSKWSFAKAIFFVNRYFPPCVFLFSIFVYFAPAPSFNVCCAQGWILGIGYMLIMTTVSAILTSRTWAVYDRSSLCLALLVTGFFACFVPSFTIVFKSITSGISADDLRTMNSIATFKDMFGNGDSVRAQDVRWQLEQCYQVGLPKHFGLIALSALSYESCLFIAMFYKMLQDKKRSKIMQSFYRDGTVYYAIMFIALGTAIGQAFSNNEVAHTIVWSQYYVAIKAMMCSRVILRLRAYFSASRMLEEFTLGDVHAAEVDTDISTIIHFADRGVVSAVSQPRNWTDAPEPTPRPSFAPPRPPSHPTKVASSPSSTRGTIYDSEMEKSENSTATPEHSSPDLTVDSFGRSSPIDRWLLPYITVVSATMGVETAELPASPTIPSQTL